MFYQASGAQLFYREIGEGEPVVLLHPTPVDHRFWLPVAEQLKNKYRLILPDLRGHGWSPKGDLPLSMSQFGDDVSSLLDSLSLSSAAFVGCSIGGYILFELWRTMPERVRSCFFCCSKPQPDSEEAKHKRLATIESVKAQGVGPFFQGAAEGLVSPSAKAQRPGIVEEVRGMMTLTTEAVIAVQEGLAARPDSLGTAADMRVPVFALAAEEDKASTPAEVEALAKAASNAEFHLLSGAGHLAAYEKPSEVAILLANFLKRTSI